jgi:hypothetical protein
MRPRAAVEEDQEWPQADLIHFSSAGKRGGVRIGGLFLLLLLAAVILIGIQLVSAYVEYLSLREAVRAIVVEVAMTPHRAEEGNARILAKVRELELPLAKEQVVFRVDAEKVLVSVRWQKPLGLWNYTVPLTFEVEESKSLR